MEDHFIPQARLRLRWMSLEVAELFAGKDQFLLTKATELRRCRANLRTPEHRVAKEFLNWIDVSVMAVKEPSLHYVRPEVSKNILRRTHQVHVNKQQGDSL